jgi:2-polyprenyl-3-methyl-5-hydroxy-6-metoxy-1,4-benzoquinol methylase
MNALVALEMLEKNDCVYRNTQLAAQYFTENSQDNVRSAMMHTAYLWDRWSTLTECVRTGTGQQRADPGERDQQWTEDFISAMNRNAAERAPLVIEAVDTSSVRRMLDVGGGSGSYSIAFARASSRLHAEVLDLPAVLPLAQKYIEKSGLSERVKTRAGDLQHDELGHDYDLVFVSAIIHMLSPGETVELFRKCARSLKPGGQLVVQDFVMDRARTNPPHGALFALNMLVATRVGDTYTEAEIRSWMKRAGVNPAQRIETGTGSTLMIGRRARR